MHIVQPDGTLFKLDVSDNHRREGGFVSIVSEEDAEGKEYDFIPGMAMASDRESIKLSPTQSEGVSVLQASGTVGDIQWSLEGRGIDFYDPTPSGPSLQSRVLQLEKSFS